MSLVERVAKRLEELGKAGSPAAKPMAYAASHDSSSSEPGARDALKLDGGEDRPILIEEHERPPHEAANGRAEHSVGARSARLEPTLERVLNAAPDAAADVLLRMRSPHTKTQRFEINFSRLAA